MKAKRTVDDSGIYQATIVEGGPDEESLREVAVAVCAAAARLPKDMDGWLDYYKAAAESILRSEGEGVRTKDADELLLRMECIRSDLERGQARSAAFNAIQAGRLIERIRVRPFERHVRHVKGKITTLQSNADEMRLPAEVIGEARTRITQLMGKGMGLCAARRKVAKELTIGLRTLERIVTGKSLANR